MLLCQVSGLRGLPAQLLLGQQHARGGQLVLHILEGRQHGLPVTRHRLVPAGCGLVYPCAGSAGVKHQLRSRQAQRPDIAGRLEQVGHAAGAGARRCAQADAGEIGAFGNAYLFVGNRHTALRACNVGPALQQRGRHTDGDVRHHRFPVGHRRQREVAGSLADQHGNRMLQLGTLPLQANSGSLAIRQLGLRLQHVGFGGNAGGVTVLRDLQSPRITLIGAFEQGLLYVCLAQGQVVDCEFALGRQPGCSKVSRTGLGTRRGTVNRPAQPAPDIGLPAAAYAQLVVVADPASGGTGAAATAAGTRGPAIERHGREQRSTLLTHHCPGLGISTHGQRHILVGHLHTRGQLVQQRIAKQRPPGTTLQRVGRDCGHPACGLLEGADLGRTWQLVLGAYGAAADQQGQCGDGQQSVRRSCRKSGMHGLVHGWTPGCSSSG